MRWSLALLLAAAVGGAVAEQCPKGCLCEGGLEMLYECGALTVRARARDYINIDCSGESLECGAVPELPLGGDARLPSLSVKRCAVSGNLTCVLSKLHATDVELVILKSVLTAVTAETFAGLTAVKKLMLYNAGAQHSMPTEAVRSLPALRHFRLVGGRVPSLPGGQFAGAPPLTYLEVGSSHTAAVAADAFAGLGHLTCLNFWGNQLRNISEDALRGLDKLEQLSLNTNELRWIPPSLLQHTPLLRNFSSTRNLLTKLPSQLFQGLQQLQEVIMSNDVDLELQPMIFANLPSLKNLVLNQCSIRQLPPDGFYNSSALLTLSMAQNKLKAIPESLFRDQIALLTLDLSFNKIEKIGAEDIFTLKSLRVLKLDHNKIESLPGQFISGLRHLERLTISSNGLKTLSPNVFLGAASLIHLDLSRNRLTLAPEVQTAEYENLDRASPFNTLVNLQTLLLSRNNLSYIFPDWRNVAIHLRDLDLSWNNFTELMTGDVHFLSTKVTVNLSHNSIRSVYFTGGFTSSGSEKEILVILEDNPLLCDCGLYPLVEAIRSPGNTLPAFQVGRTSCASPGSLKGDAIKDVVLDDLTCSTNCTDSCQCTVRPSKKTLELYCKELSPIPSPSEYGMAEAYVKLLNSPRGLIEIPDRANSVDLSGLGLKEVPFTSLPASTETVDLRDNAFAELPLGLLRRNISVKLSGNAFDCDCWHADEVAAAAAMKVLIEDFEEVICVDGSRLSRIDASRLCDVLRATVAGTVLTLLGVGVAAVAAFLYCYSLEVRVYLYSKRWLRSLLPRHYEESKPYDVFISFSHKDEEFVRDELMARLEPEFRVCVHYRDWVVGDMIPTQITKSVEQSKRTVVVLSKSFLESQWGMNEFRVAHALAVKEKQVRVIVILLEDCLNLDKDHEELKAYLSTNTYIKWGDPMFWGRLRYALPHDSASRIGRGKFQKGGLNVELNSEGQLINAAFKDSI